MAVSGVGLSRGHQSNPVQGQAVGLRVQLPVFPYQTIIPPLTTCVDHPLVQRSPRTALVTIIVTGTTFAVNVPIVRPIFDCEWTAPSRNGTVVPKRQGLPRKSFAVSPGCDRSRLDSGRGRVQASWR